MNIVFVVAFAACVGSFLNVVVYRLPRGESLSFPGSRCPSCGYAIKWFDNIPLLSWLLLKGQCRQCKTPISPRYLIVEASTAALAAGLYICLYVLDMREGMGEFHDSWITFIALAALVAGLLACSIIDIEHWIVPLEVCWAVSALGVITATVAPPSEQNQILSPVSPGLGAAGIGAVVGLIISLILQRKGLLQQSFIDAENRPIPLDEPSKEPDTSDKSSQTVQKKSKRKGRGKGKKKKKKGKNSAPQTPQPNETDSAIPRSGFLASAIGEISFLAPIVVFGVIAYFIMAPTGSRHGGPELTNRAIVVSVVIMGGLLGLAASLLLRKMGFIQRGLMDTKAPPPAVAITRDHGVNPRLEILWEVLFLAPALLLALGAYLLVTHVPALNSAREYFNDTRVEHVNLNYTYRSGWRYANNLVGFERAIVGYLIGGAWIWGMRIFGTLGFGKEAMGLGDVHILAAVGAVCGWITPSLVFFIAPIVALLWAMHLMASGKQRELPYGPWLAGAALLVILFYDAIIKMLKPSFETFAR